MVFDSEPMTGMPSPEKCIFGLSWPDLWPFDLKS